MFRKIVLVFVLILSLTGVVFAAENASVESKMVGATFKTLAKAYVATTDIEKLKAKKIQRIESMSEEWFAEKYDEVYPDIRKMPPSILKKYRVTEQLNKAQAIRIIRTLDKKKLYEIIDNVPDAVIAQKFNEQFGEDGSAEHVSLQDRIARAWDKFLVKINQGAATGKKQNRQ
jgi:rhamnose utilization protein RhaD (predicted bifunctional aldolase and dehydrogenase)